MKNTDKAGIKGLVFIDIPEHANNSTSNSRKEAVQKRPFFREIESEFLRNDKDTLAVGTVNEFRSHGSRACNRIFVATGRAEAAVTAKGAKLIKAAARTGIHGATKKRSP